MIETSWIFLESLQQWVIPEKIHTPRRMGSFFNPPPSHLDCLKHKTLPPVWISKTKDPLLPGFPGKIIRLKFLIENILEKFHCVEVRKERSKNAKKRTSVYILSS